MAKMKLAESSFTLIPEGTTTFKIMSVDDSKYEDFGKLAVKMVTAKGETHVENFSLLKAGGEINEGALKAWSYFARTCLKISSVVTLLRRSNMRPLLGPRATMPDRRVRPSV